MLGPRSLGWRSECSGPTGCSWTSSARGPAARSRRPRGRPWAWTSRRDPRLRSAKSPSRTSKTSSPHTRRMCRAAPTPRRPTGSWRSGCPRRRISRSRIRSCLPRRCRLGSRTSPTAPRSERASPTSWTKPCASRASRLGPSSEGALSIAHYAAPNVIWSASMLATIARTTCSLPSTAGWTGILAFHPSTTAWDTRPGRERTNARTALGEDSRSTFARTTPLGCHLSATTPAPPQSAMYSTSALLGSTVGRPSWSTFRPWQTAARRSGWRVSSRRAAR
mmetsp:Transcript_137473/g.439244  ORF Transcript_137473/g.439244 Transcript_137473/m.439244 type:complete len:278 (-) Transcript_137473:168-1001(-)